MMPVRKPQMTNHMTIDGRGSQLSDQHVWSNIHRLEMRSKVWFELDGDFVIGEGGADLLAQIERHRSLARAAREIGWSYRHAWGYLRRAQRTLSCSLAEAVAGKGSQRGMRLTAAGEWLLSTLTEARNSALVATSERKVHPRWPATEE